jgi:hypothetical protein
MLRVRICNTDRYPTNLFSVFLCDYICFYKIAAKNILVMFVKVGEGGNLKSVNGELYAPLQHVSAGTIHIQSLVSCIFTSSDPCRVS